jgi:hypothetical protein
MPYSLSWAICVASYPRQVDKTSSVCCPNRGGGVYWRDASDIRMGDPDMVYPSGKVPEPYCEAVVRHERHEGIDVVTILRLGKGLQKLSGYLMYHMSHDVFSRICCYTGIDHGSGGVLRVTLYDGEFT